MEPWITRRPIRALLTRWLRDHATPPCHRHRAPGSSLGEGRHTRPGQTAKPLLAKPETRCCRKRQRVFIELGLATLIRSHPALERTEPQVMDEFGLRHNREWTTISKISLGI